MNSIAVTKPDMGVLSRERLQLSPFGILAQTFAEDLLARAEQKEGLWSYVPLELLEEGERVTPSEGVRPKVTLQVDLQLVLEALRREEGRSEQQQATERIVERVLQLQARRGPAPSERAAVPERSAAPAAPGIVRQEFHQHLTQNIHITQSLSQGADQRQQRPPGDLARQAEAFSQRLQTLREEGMAFPRESAAEQGRAHVFKLPEGASQLSPAYAPQKAALPPQEALELLENGGEESARAAERAQAALAQSGERLQSLLEQVLSHKEKEPSPGRGSAASQERGDGEKTSAGVTGQTVRTEDGGERRTRGPGRTVQPTASGKPHREPAAGEHQPGSAERPAGEGRPGRGKAVAGEGGQAAQREESSGPKVSDSKKSPARPAASGSSWAQGTVRKGQAAGERTPSETDQPDLGEAHGGEAQHTARPMEKFTPTGEAASGVSTPLSTTARDIRMGPESLLRETMGQRFESAGPTAAAQFQEGAQPPVELSYRTAGEGESTPHEEDAPKNWRKVSKDGPAGSAEPAGQSEKRTASGETGTGQRAVAHETVTGQRAQTGEQQNNRPDSRRQDAVQRSASGADRKKRASSGPNEQETRMGEVTGEGASPHASGHTVKAAMGNFSPENLQTSGKAAGEDPRIGSFLTLEKAASPTVPAPRTLSPTVRDIRTGGNPPEDRGSVQDGAEQPLLPLAEQAVQPPVELSHRTAAESAPWAETDSQGMGKEKPQQDPSAPASVRRKERGEKHRGGADGPRRAAGAGETETGRHAGVGESQKDRQDDPRRDTVQGTASEADRKKSAAPGRDDQDPRGKIPGEGTQTDAPHHTERAAGEGLLTGSSQPLGKTASPAVPDPRTLSPTARDIRLGLGSLLGEQGDAQTSAEQALSYQVEQMAQPPMELSHRLTEAGGDFPLEGDAAGRRARRPGQALAAPGAENRQSGESSLGGKAESGLRIRTGPRPDGQRGAQGEFIRRPALGKARAGSAAEADSKAPGGSTLPSTLPTAKTVAAAAANIGTLPAAARDIRVGGGNSLGERNGAEGPQLSHQAEPVSQIPLELSHRAELAGGAGAEFPLSGDLPLNQPGRAGEIGVSGGQMAPMAGESTRPAGAAPFQPEPLTYGPGQPADIRHSQGAAPRQSGGGVDLQNLPDWAKRFLREGAPSGPGGRTMGVARDIASLPLPETGDSVHWTAPSYQPPEAPMAYREREQAPQRRESGEIRISDAEIQRTADQVYRLIEERLRRERRRLGF